MPNFRRADALGVNVKTLKNIAAVLCVAALAVPAAVLAKGPGSNGNHGPNGTHGNPNTPHKPSHVNKRCKKQPKVGFVVGGKLDPASTADTITVDVTRSNKHSKPFVTDGKFTFNTAGVKVRYVGDNPFTTPGAELHRGDWKVQVVGKVIKLKKGCNADNAPAPTVRKATVIAPGAGDSGSNESGDNQSGNNESGSNS
jgi:hypothetical protein